MSSRPQTPPETKSTTALLDPVRTCKRGEKRTAVRADHDSAVHAPSGLYAEHGRALFNAGLVLVILPIVLIVASVVTLVNLVLFRDVRKILFVQPRVGLHGRVFSIYKFRTMSEPKQSAHDSWQNGDDTSRVTTFGRFLRNTHLDELPQMLNILKGDMDVIGPRPEMVEIEAWASEHLPNFTQRLSIRPGITGIAQITQGYTGHDIEAYAEKLAINLAYIRDMSFALDVEICLRTIVWMLRGKGWDWNHASTKRR